MRLTKAPNRRRTLGRRGGVLLDFVLAVAFILFAAFALNLLGLTFHMILSGAAHFFGI